MTERVRHYIIHSHDIGTPCNALSCPVAHAYAVYPHGSSAVGIWPSEIPQFTAQAEEIERLQADGERLALVERWSNGEIAEMFHRNYERLAPLYSYETRKASAVPWIDVPEPNRCLMLATVSAVLQDMTTPDPARAESQAGEG